MGGTFDKVRGQRSLDLSTLLAVGTDREFERLGTCTLLGPEGPDALDLRVGADEPLDLF